MRVAYVGNFEPTHSTENHVAAAFERQGHDVVRLQENTIATWTHPAPPCDFVLWTRTGWDWSGLGWTLEDAHEAQLHFLDELTVPAVGFHLDRWWGLDREGQVYDEPFFQCDLVATADGGHPNEWKAAGVNHLWLPPGVLLAECERAPRGMRPPPPVVWVGSWNRYHPEWVDYRIRLINTVRDHFGRRFGLYPRAGRAVRGRDLTELYAAASVVVGDSCLAGGATRYWSDRIPETLGRGGYLIHPEVDGLEDHFTPGQHFDTYPLGDWPALITAIERGLDDPGHVAAVREAGRAHVMEHHTYERRVEQLTEAL